MPLGIKPSAKPTLTPPPRSLLLSSPIHTTPHPPSFLHTVPEEHTSLTGHLQTRRPSTRDESSLFFFVFFQPGLSSSGGSACTSTAAASVLELAVVVVGRECRAAPAGGSAAAGVAAIDARRQAVDVGRRRAEALRDQRGRELGAPEDTASKVESHPQPIKIGTSVRACLLLQLFVLSLCICVSTVYCGSVI